MKNTITSLLISFLSLTAFADVYDRLEGKYVATDKSGMVVGEMTIMKDYLDGPQLLLGYKPVSLSSLRLSIGTQDHPCQYIGLDAANSEYSCTMAGPQDNQEELRTYGFKIKSNGKVVMSDITGVILELTPKK